MIATQWIKVLKDLWVSKVRTLLVVLSITVGVFAVGTISFSFSVLMPDLDADYARANPHGATIYSAPFDDEMVNVARKVPGVAMTEGRSSIGAQIQDPKGEWLSIAINSIHSISEVNIDKIFPEPGSPTPTLGKDEIIVERNGLSLIPLKIGDTVQIKMGDGHTRALKVSGIVHDINANPAFFTRNLTAFVSPDTLENLGGLSQYDTLLITVKENPKDEAHVKAVAMEVSDKIKKSGREVYVTLVYQPGSHPIRQIIQTLLVMMAAFGGLVVFLSAFLVINTINSLLNQQIRQIGIMKSLGANTRQIISMYMLLVTCFGLLSLLIALPLSTLTAFTLMRGMAGMLNFDLGAIRVPLSTVLLETFIAVVIPLAAALLPVLKGARITIRKAITHYGLSSDVFGGNAIDRLLEKISNLPRPVVFSLRNTFRRKARLLLTLSTLTLAGAIFIGVFNVQAGFSLAINETLGYFLSDVNISLNRSYRVERIQQDIQNVPDVVTLESWGVYPAKLLSNDQTTGTDVIFWAPPSDSKLIKPVVKAGRWLMPGDENAIVVGNHLLKKRPDIKVGDTLTTEIRGKDYDWQVVGIFQMAGNVEPPFVYANYEYFSQIMGETGRANTFRAITRTSDATVEEKAAVGIKDVLKTDGIDASTETGNVVRESNARSINILVIALLAMAILIALVGSIGLMGTMSINVMERTREIGVLRSIGANDASVLFIILQEGMLIGMISWMLGALLSLPIGQMLSYLVGVSFVNAPLPFVFSMSGFIIWLIAVLVLSALASILPALNAVRLTVRDTLAYE
jgi:putative ABC transport system permease protein